ncbi:MAG: signal recognition particle protein [Bacteroidetes bacterium]|nr:signal recognition particle protein [Bacteroidota bacterium]
MFENLSDSINKAIKKLKGQAKITEINISSALKEIRRALVSADVNYKIAKEVTDKIKKEALGRDVLISVSPGQLLTKIVKDELTKLMGGSKSEVDLSGNPSIILVSGLQGSGKTTFCAKLANKLKNEGKSVLLVACDVYRPAAINQLKTLAESIEVEVYSEDDNKNVKSIAKNGISKAQKEKKKIVIIDTAGRLAIDENMMKELEELKKEVNPQETLFVVDSMTGQDAVNTAKTFNDRIDFDGIVLTKLDGDTRGGAALTIKNVVNKPIKFIGTGEKIENLDIFHPDRMAGRILGMGDVISVVERAQQIYDDEEAKRLTKKICKNKFDYNDFLGQIKNLKKLGNLKDIAGMIPGLGNKVKNLNVNDNAFKPFEIMIYSMTPLERSNPDIIDFGRKTRIAKGSGINIDEIGKLMNNFKDMRKTMRLMSKKKGGFDNMLESFNVKT